MLKAKDKFGQVCTIFDANPDELYCCRICDQPLSQRRKADIKRPCFAHFPANSKGRNYTPCTDKWNYDKTEWHENWQRSFPDECYEVVVEHDGEKHIADILINNTVIEFQHSGISYENFSKRNRFYKSCGFEVVWLFDVIEEYQTKSIQKDRHGDEYRWKSPKQIFRKINRVKDENATIYFQFSENGSKEAIMRISSAYEDFRLFYTDERHSFSIEEFIQISNHNTAKLIQSPPIVIPKETIDKIKNQKSGKTIEQLWRWENQSMVVENLYNGNHIFISGDFGRMKTLYGTITGKFTWKNSNGEFDYSKKAYPISYANDPIWKIVYSKKRELPKHNVEDKKINIGNQGIVFPTRESYQKQSGVSSALDIMEPRDFPDGKDLFEVVEGKGATPVKARCLVDGNIYLIEFSHRTWNLPGIPFLIKMVDLETGEVEDCSLRLKFSNCERSKMWDIIEEQD